MNSAHRNRPLPAGNPIANALVVIVGVLAIGLSLVLGVVVFIALGSLFLVMAGIIGIRLWWVQRKYGRQARRTAPGDPQRPDVIEGEFRVITRDSRHSRDGRD